jgi:hypothetical protein
MASGKRARIRHRVLTQTPGESAFEQDEYEEAMDRLDDMAVKLSVM